jgi:hypothetical protein
MSLTSREYTIYLQDLSGEYRATIYRQATSRERAIGQLTEELKFEMRAMYAHHWHSERQLTVYIAAATRQENIHAAGNIAINSHPTHAAGAQIQLGGLRRKTGEIQHRGARNLEEYGPADRERFEQIHARKAR